MRRLIAGLTALFLLLSIILISTVITSAAVRRKGDVDLDGEVTIIDATVIQRVLVEMIEDTDGHILRYGDIDGDGLSIMDVTFIQRYLAQMNDGCCGSHVRAASAVPQRRYFVPLLSRQTDSISLLQCS